MKFSQWFCGGDDVVPSGTSLTRPDSPSAPPHGDDGSPVVLVCTDISDSVRLWETGHKLMPNVMKQHNAILRSLIREHNGSEISFQGQSFIISFLHSTDAINWCLAAQEALLNASWPSPILNIPSCKKEDGNNGRLLWQGPRVKMAVMKGPLQKFEDKVYHRVNYGGFVVKKVRQLCDHGNAGVIVVTKSTYDSIDQTKLNKQIVARDHADHSSLVLITKDLEGRLPKTSAPPTTPGDIIVKPFNDESFANMTSLIRTSHKKMPVPKPHNNIEWIVKFDDLALRHQIGIGPSAEVHSAIYFGSEVAVKQLLNQTLPEENSFSMRNVAAVLHKLSHPHIVKFIGIGIEPPHICIVTELLSTNLYKFYISPASFPYSEKIRIAKGIAKGMLYLCECDDPTLSQNLRLTSNNVLLGKNGGVKITDFALNKLYNRTTSIHPWTAPEMLGGQNPPTFSAPVYSFGIILWEMAARKKPYAAIHPTLLLSMIAQGHRPEVPHDCPSSYLSLMSECWSGNPGDRPSWTSILQRLDTM